MRVPLDRKQTRILVVDDSKSTLIYVSNLLLAQGFGWVETADSAEQALKVVRGLDGTHFDLVLLDRYIGDDSGIDVLKKIRSFDKEVVIIMITQEDSSPKVMEAIAAGANDYIVKPFNEETVGHKLSKFVI